MRAYQAMPSKRILVAVSAIYADIALQGDLSEHKSKEIRKGA
jgi:hypothetical protein